MSAEEPITLKEIQLRLGVPQHVLIHLCEKGVVEPDFAGTSGRGKRRGFSRRNLFEFGVAIALRRFELPVAMAAFIVRTLRSFGRAAAKASPGFALPGSLASGAVDLALHIYDGELLALTARGSGFARPLILSAKIGDPSRAADSVPRVTKLDELPDAYEAHLEVNISRIARNIMQDGLRK